MSTYISTGAFLSRNLEEVLSTAKVNGFAVELSSSVDYSAEMVSLVKRWKDKLPLLVHNYFPPPAQPFVLNLAASDSETHQKGVQLCEKAIDLTAELGAPFYSVHAGFALDLVPMQLGKPEAQVAASLRIPRPQAYETFVSTVRDLANYAAKRGVGLLIENNVAAKENIDDNGESRVLLADPDEICRFFLDIGSPSVRLLLDVGHAHVSARSLGKDPHDFFRQVADWIAAFHLSDNDGNRDSNQMFGKEAWFAGHLKSKKNLPMILETYRLPTDKIKKQCETLREILS